MAPNPSNPFQPKEVRSLIKPTRYTQAEYDAVMAIATRENVDFSDLVREGLGLVIAKRNKQAKGRK